MDRFDFPLAKALTRRRLLAAGAGGAAATIAARALAADVDLRLPLSLIHI